jgi:small-conductance mechanosensitive channel
VEQFIALLKSDGSLMLTARMIAVVLAAFIIGMPAVAVIFAFLRRLARRSETMIDDRIVRYSRKPAMIILPLILIKLSLPLVGLADDPQSVFSHIFSLLLIASITYLALNATFAVRDIILDQYDVKATDNLSARKITTQVRILERIAVVVLILIGGAAMLMTFSGIRQIGVSLLASAGITGIIIGFAAQRSLATLLAGIQIAITQPIRIDDVVIVEGEWGRIEEITLTFVVVRIWDLRRLVLPITYFIEKPFQNWTRTSADILGTVYLYTDYTVPVEAIRHETRRLAEQSELWDGKVCGVQVTNATPEVLEVRLLVSAGDSSKAWDLRCQMREAMITFIRSNYPDSLPRTRAELHGGKLAIQQPASNEKSTAG